MGKITFTPDDFAAAAIQYRKELLMAPIIGLQSSLAYMTARPGIRYAERVGTLSGNVQVQPYRSSVKSDDDFKLAFRELRTHLGAVVQNFEPNSVASTILGIGATKGDGMATTPSAYSVLKLVAEGISETLNDALFSAKRNPDGTTTKTLFDGFDTITDAEKQAGNIATEKNNYMKLTEAITPANAVDALKSILYSLDPKLRNQDLNLYCSPEIADAYNEGYLLTHGATPYNQQFGQTAVEGSYGKLKIVPLTNKSGSKYIHICPKSNMLVGFDQMGDIENVMVKEYAPFILTYVATMFFGVQFESIDSNRFKAIELA